MCLTVSMTRPADVSADVGSFDVTYRRELPTMIALATTMTGDTHLGADIAYEAMLRLYREWTRVGAMERPGAWVRRVVINLAIDARRSRMRESLAISRLNPNPTTDAAEPTSEQFWIAVRALPDRQRAAIALHYIDDMAVADIADVLGVTVGTVKTSLFYARRSLAKTLGTQEADDADD